MENTHDDIHPLIKDVLENLGRYTWTEYKKRNNYEGSRSAAQKLWARYAKSHNLPIELPREDAPKRTKYPPPDLSALELRGLTLDGEGNIITQRLGRPNTPTELPDFSAFTLDAATTNPNGGAWLKYKAEKPPIEELTPDQRYEFETRRTELLSSIGHHSIEIPAPTKEHENWLIIGCAHVPHHNRYIWNGLLKYLQSHPIDGVILAGDFLDLKSLSAHEKGQVRDVTLWQEYESAIPVIAELESVLPAHCRKVFVFGNHEDRYNRILKEVENSRFGDALLSPERALGMDKTGWEVLRNWKEDFVKLAPDLLVFHGNKTGDNPAQKELKDCILSNTSAIFFHTHRFGVASNGKIAAYNCGMLGDIESEAFKYLSWRERQHWLNGFCLTSLTKSDYYINPVRCANNGFILDGLFYKG